MVRRMMPVFRRAGRALENLNLINALRSEINHELSTPTSFQTNSIASPGDFTVDWDSSESEDVVLRRKSESGEEVAVSALLGQILPEPRGPTYPRDVLMKVCVKKPGCSSLLQFDCEAYEDAPFSIRAAYFLQSNDCPRPCAYKGPLFSTLDPDLQGALKEYLIVKGINHHLINFLLQHLHTKEQGQYVNWLQKLESMMDGKTKQDDAE